ncbi:MAG: hypothetical protein A2W26_12885 [Acidobacteria bacterium RBG_16_64_8]|nr:MAG: hypothetical protein A2W26_12885 [Acidobacteria bacterium RBG_16_64_8]
MEDDVGIGRFLRQGLVEAGYEADWERDGMRWLERAISDVHDLLILDIRLPDISGLQPRRMAPIFSKRWAGPLPALILTMTFRVLGSAA